jgi:hypothetical protein
MLGMAITKVSLNLEYLVNAWKGDYSHAYGVSNKAVSTFEVKSITEMMRLTEEFEENAAGT